MTDLAAKAQRVNWRLGLVRLLIVSAVAYFAAASFATVQAYREAKPEPWFEAGRIRTAASQGPSGRLERGTFAYQGAERAGYSDTEIAEYLSKERAFDLLAARRAGLSDREIAMGLAAIPTATADKLKSTAQRRGGTAAAARSLAVWGSVFAGLAFVIASAWWIVSGFVGKAARCPS